MYAIISKKICSRLTVGCKINEERLVVGNISLGFSFLVRFDELDRLGKPNVRAIPLKLLGLAIYKVCVIKVVIPPGIRGVADAAATVVDAEVEATLKGPQGRCVAQVPFSQMCRGISNLAQSLGQRELVLSEEGVAANGMPNAGRIGVVAGEQPRSRRSASRPTVVVGELDGVGRICQLIEMGGADVLIARVSQLAVPLVVSEDEDYIRTRRLWLVAANRGVRGGHDVWLAVTDLMDGSLIFALWLCFGLAGLAGIFLKSDC